MGSRTASTNARIAPGVSAWVSMMPWTPVASTWLNIQALARTVASSVPFTGTLTMTAGVRWPLFVGPPATSPFMYSARPCDVERRVLHVVADVVRVGLRVLLALFESTGCT